MNDILMAIGYIVVGLVAFSGALLGFKGLAGLYIFDRLGKGKLRDGQGGMYFFELDKQGNLFIYFQLMKQEALEKYYDATAKLKAGNIVPDPELTWFERKFGRVKVGAIPYYVIDSYGLEGLAEILINFTRGEEQ